MEASLRTEAHGNPRSADLLAYVEGLAEDREGRRALHIHLSHTERFGLSAQQTRMVASVFETAVEGLEGRTFNLEDGDIVFVGFAREAAGMQKAIQKVRFMLEGARGDSAPIDEAEFLAWYDLEKEYNIFLADVRALQNQPHGASRRAVAPGHRRAPLDPVQLAGLERALAMADITTLVKQQAICFVGTDMTPRRVLTENFTSIEYVEQVLAPDTDLKASRFLFQYLTQILDTRMLAFLRADRHKRLGRYVSINLNVSTLLSPAFLAFDRSLPASTRGRIVIEFQYTDVISDPRVFAFARDFAREQSYRLCLDGVQIDNLPLIDREALGVEFIKLMWNSNLEARAALTPEAIRRQVAAIGPERLILHLCETERAVKSGQAVGIRLFQGHFVDELLARHEQVARSVLDVEGGAPH